jgi:hypothetical protein
MNRNVVKNMNVHERVWKTLEHEEPDRVPTLIQTFERPFIEKYNQSLTKLERFRNRFIPHYNQEVARQLEIDALWFHYGHHKIPHRDRPAIPEDIQKQYGFTSVNDWGQVFEKNATTGMGWYKDGALKTPEYLKEWISYLKEWEPADEKYFKLFKIIWDNHIKKGVLPIPTGGGVSYATWSMIGLNRFAYMTRKHRGLVKELTQALGKNTMDFQTGMFEHGVDMCFLCDDWAQKDRILFNPKDWDDIIGPVYKQIADNAHKRNGKFLVHTDGNITDCVEYIVKAGADAVEPLEYEAGTRLKPLKERFGDKITLIGNVPATFTLTYGSVEDTIKATKQCLLDAAEGGGYILGAGSDILGTCKLENVIAMVQTVKKYGTYPINKSNLV